MRRPDGRAESPAGSFQPGESLEIRIDSLAFGGAGVGRSDGFVLLVDGGLPGDLLRVEITQRARKFARARVLAILEPSPHRRPAECSHVPECGGCVYQSLDPGAQREAKRRQVADLLRRVGGFPDPPVAETIPAPAMLHYRNRMAYTVPGRPGDGPGLHGREFEGRILEVPDCRIARVDVHAAYLALLDDFRRLDPGSRPHQILIQAGDDGAPPVALFRGDREPAPGFRSLARGWVDSRKAISGALWEVRRRTGSRRPGSIRRIAGRGAVEIGLGPYRFEVPAGCFFQAHADAAALLFARVAAACGEVQDEVLELFGGVGALGLHLCRPGRRVLAVEGDARAVEAARRNAVRNGAAGLEILLREAGAALGEFEREGRRFSAVVLDPPRSGLPPGDAGKLARIAADRILYVACDPATLARDLGQIRETGGWVLEEVVPVDLFPHTAGIECLALLHPRGGG